VLKESRYNVWSEVGDRHFVFNGRSGVLVQMTAGQRSALDAVLVGATELSEDIAELLQALVQTSVLVSETTDELELLERDYTASRDLESVNLTVVTSMGCNFDCPYCFESKYPALLEDRVADAIVALVALRLPAPVVDITWFGGEPLVGRRQLLSLAARLQELCAANGTRFQGSIITNGWYLDGATAAALAAHGVESAQVTLDGPREINDRSRPHKNRRLSTYDRIVDNLTEAVEHLRIDVRVNLARDNAAHLDQLLADLESRGLRDRLTVSPARIRAAGEQTQVTNHDQFFTTAAFAEYESAVSPLLEQHGFGGQGLPTPIGAPCTAVRKNELVIGPAGELWKCWEEVADRRAQLGSIFDIAHLGDVDTRGWLDETPFIDPQCRDCTALPVCMGGCPKMARNGNRDGQCGTFRHNHQRRIDAVAQALCGVDAPDHAQALSEIAGILGQPTAPAPGSPVPVVLGPRRRLEFVPATAPAG